MKSRQLSISLVFLFFATVAQMTAADDNPYRGLFWVRADSAPVFYWENGVNSADGIIKKGLVIEEVVIDLDGGIVVYNDEHLKGFYFVKLRDVVDDPRLTEWWEKSRVSCKGKSLWRRVEHAACSEDHPEVTQLIISEMVRTGATSEKEVTRGKMTPDRLDQIMLAYSEQVWD